MSVSWDRLAQLGERRPTDPALQCLIQQMGSLLCSWQKMGNLNFFNFSLINAITGHSKADFTLSWHSKLVLMSFADVCDIIYLLCNSTTILATRSRNMWTSPLIMKINVNRPREETYQWGPHHRGVRAREEEDGNKISCLFCKILL